MASQKELREALRFMTIRDAYFFGECTAHGPTLSEAYHDALTRLYLSGEWSNCQDWNTDQLECSMTMTVLKPLEEPMISKLFIGGPLELQQYTMEMLDGILDFEVEKGNWSYTYHQRMTEPVNQIQFVIDELKRNPSSRRAVIMTRDIVKDTKSSDPACLQHIQYFIRGDKLYSKVLFRSNDALKATFMNAYALIRLQEKIANELGVEMGSYVHRANSFHCYKKDFDTLERYAEVIAKAEEDFDLNSIAYSYEDDWKDEMEESVSAILEKVEVLKR